MFEIFCLNRQSIIALDFVFLLFFSFVESSTKCNFCTDIFIFANIRMRNVMKWCCAASSSANVEISSSSRKQLLDNIVLPFTITKTCGIHLHPSDKYILFPPPFLPLYCKPSALLASLYFMIVCACMLIARYISRSIHQIFSASFAFSFPTGIKPLFVRTCEF